MNPVACMCGLAVFVDRAAVICARVMRAEIQCSVEYVHVCCFGLKMRMLTVFLLKRTQCVRLTHAKLSRWDTKHSMLCRSVSGFDNTYVCCQHTIICNPCVC